MALLNGYDISAFQAATAPKADFLFVKATEGTSYTSSKFAAQWASAKKNAKVRGAYHFARPEDSSAEAQADRFLRVVKPTGSDLLCLDLEVSGLSQSRTNAWARAFGDRLREKAPGIKTVLYMGHGYSSNGTGKDLSKHFDLWWYPQYPSSKATTKWPTSFSPWIGSPNNTGWAKPHIWQWSSAFAGKLDANVSWLSIADLVARADAQAPNPAPPPVPKPAVITSGTSASEILKIAASQIGTGESPPGSNHNKYTAWYGANGAWCYMFVSWVFDQAGALSLVHGKNAYVPNCRSVFRPRGEWHTSEPRPGDLVCFDFNRSGEPEHIGIVERVLSSTTIQTIEGNTGGSRGDGVYRKTRRRADVYGYARPAYGSAVTTEDDDFMAQYVSISKDDESRHEELADGKWQQVYFNRNNSAAAAKHHAKGDYPSVVTGGHDYNGVINLRLAGLPKGAEGQVRCLYTDAKTNAVKSRGYITEFVGSTGDTFVSHPVVGHVPVGQKLRVEIAVYEIGDAAPVVVEGAVRMHAKEI